MQRFARIETETEAGDGSGIVAEIVILPDTITVLLVDKAGEPILTEGTPVLDKKGEPVLEGATPVLDDEGQPVLGDDGEPELEGGTPVMTGRTLQYRDRPMAPADAFEPSIAATLVSCADEVEAGWRYDGSVFAEPPALPVPDPEPRVLTLAALLAALSDAEYDAVDAAMQGLSARRTRMWAAASEVREDGDLWAPLTKALAGTIGKDRTFDLTG